MSGLRLNSGVLPEQACSLLFPFMQSLKRRKKRSLLQNQLLSHYTSPSFGFYCLNFLGSIVLFFSSLHRHRCPVPFGHLRCGESSSASVAFTQSPRQTTVETHSPPHPTPNVEVMKGHALDLGSGTQRALTPTSSPVSSIFQAYPEAFLPGSSTIPPLSHHLRFLPLAPSLFSAQQPR